MSFSSDVKEALSKITNLTDKEAVKYELLGYLISQNTTCNKQKIQYTTENEYTINRFGKLLSNCGITDFSISMKGKNYIIHFQNKKDRFINLKEVQIIEDNIEIIPPINIETLLQNEKIGKAFIRGTFLGSGSVNHPEKKYHLEIALRTANNAEVVQNILQSVEITMKRLNRKNGVTLYLKDGEEISNFLAYIGASQAVLKFEEIRVLRQMKNKINRKVNCETANLSKTIAASVKQVEAIKHLQKNGKFETLPDNLKEIAILRLENPDASLVELGEMLASPIGKSGVNHRLKAIIELGNDKEG